MSKYSKFVTFLKDDQLYLCIKAFLSLDTPGFALEIAVIFIQTKSYDKFGYQILKSIYRYTSHAHFNGDLMNSRAGLDFVTMRPFLPVWRIEPKSTIPWLVGLWDKKGISCSAE
jgi:hypothetical protein